MEEKTRICNKMVIFYCVIADYISSFTQSKLVKNGTPPVGYAGKGTVARGFGGGRLDMPAAKNTADANASAV